MTANRFGALMDEGEEVDAPFIPAVTKKDNKKITPALVPVKSTDKPVVTAPDETAQKRRDDRGGAPMRDRDNRAPGGSGGSARPGAATRGPRGSRLPKHEQDRQSVSLKEGEKRQNNGPGGWGKLEDGAGGADDVEGVTASAPKREPREPREPRAQTEEEIAYAAAQQKEREDEEKQMTLDEYRAQKTSKAPTFKERKPNEGADSKAMKGTQILVKDNTEDFFMGKKAGTALSDKPKEKVVPVAKKVEATPGKALLYEPKSYADESRGSGGGKGARGGKGAAGSPTPAGGNSSRGPRGPRQAPPPAVDSNEAFPTLGGK